MQKRLIFFFLLITGIAFSQKTIHIKSADITTKDEENFPGAVILLGNVFVEVDGATLQCKKALVYGEDDFLEAVGNVVLKQGDTITQTSKYINYDGKTKQALSWGNVVLKNKSMTLTTDTLHFDREKQLLFYKDKGVIVDKVNKLTSVRGYYYLANHKFTAQTDVEITHPDYLLNSKHLDYFTKTGLAYLFGKSTIKGKESFIYGEKGFSDTNAGQSYFTKNAYILYNDRRIDADSLYYDKKHAFASATNNIVMTDTINNMILKGNYAEYYRKIDSAFIVKRAVAITKTEKDSLYMHGDTILLTGKPNNRIVRAFHNVKFYKNDLQGKCDSIHSNTKIGILKMFKSPVLWTENGQITGDLILLKNDTISNKIDSLKVLGNAFLVEKDTIEGFNQIKGRDMFAKFIKSQIKTVDFVGNGEVLAYVREDNPKRELFGITKTTCSKIRFIFKNKQIVSGTFYNDEETFTYPPSKLPKNARKLKGFIWRDDERPKNKEDIFIKDTFSGKKEINSKPYLKKNLKQNILKIDNDKIKDKKE
jgi:lipopolysaccharide export system protein LptA